MINWNVQFYREEILLSIYNERFNIFDFTVTRWSCTERECSYVLHASFVAVIVSSNARLRLYVERGLKIFSVPPVSPMRRM